MIDVQRRRRLPASRGSASARCACAARRRRADVERVGPRPRRVRRRVVERVEVVEDGLDLGALEDVEAEADEDVLDLAPGRVSRCRRPDRLRRVAGQRDVDAVGDEPRVELGGARARPARLDRASSAAAGLVGGLAHRAALLGRQLGDAAQEVGQLGLAAEVAGPAAPRARPWWTAARSPPRAWPRAICSMRSIMRRLLSIRRAPPSRPSPRSATPPRSGCAATASHAATTSAGSPSRSAPTTSVHVRRRRPLQRLARARDQRDASPGSSATASPRATGTAKIAPIDARTALGPYGSAVPGPIATRRRRRRARRAARCRRCPGPARPTARRTAARRARRPALLVDGRARACPEPSAETSASSAGSTSTPVSPRPQPKRRRGAQPAASAAATRSSPSATNAPAVAPRRSEPADVLECCCGGW